MTDDEPLALATRLLTAVPTPAETEAWRRPPHPTPAALAEDEARVRTRLGAVPSSHDDRPTALRPLATTQPFAQVRAQVLRPGAPFRPADAVGLLVAGGLLTAADVDLLVATTRPDRTVEGGLRREVVLSHLWAGDVDAAVSAAAAMGDLAFAGRRDVGAHHARAGDADAFLAGWKGYAASRERAGMDRLRTDLVRGVAEHHGWEAASAVAADRRIGPRTAATAFAPWAAAGDVEGLSGAFAAGGPAHGVLGELDELGVLVDAVVAAAPPAPLADVDGLAAVVTRLRAVDPSRDKATMRRRDGLLARLWPAVGDEATLVELRRAVRTPALRRELGRLARDVR